MYRLIKKEGPRRGAENLRQYMVPCRPCIYECGNFSAIKGGISSIDLVDLSVRLSCAIPIICMFVPGMM